MSLNLDDLQSIIEEATRRAFKEKISPLIENEEERDRQKQLAKDIKDLQSGKKGSGDLDEADDEEKEEEPSNKAALGKEEAPDGGGDAPNAVMPTADDMAEADVGQIINMLNILSTRFSRGCP